MGYTLFPNDDKAQTDGSAIDATSTIIDGGTGYNVGALGIVAANPLTAKVDPGFLVAIYGSQVVQNKFLYSALEAAGVTITSVADDTNGFCDFTLSTHGLTVGTVINVTGSSDANVDGIQKITSLPDANSFVTDKAFVTTATAGVYHITAGNFALMTAEKYIIMRVTTEVAGQSNNVLRSGGADFGDRRSINKLEHLYTTRTATAIRAGFWNIFTGEFTTAPVTADDIGTVGTDDAAVPTQAIPGELVYKEPKPLPVQDNYQARSIW